MSRKLLVLAALFGTTISAFAAETTKTKFNPFTSKLDYITSMNGSSWPSPDASGCLANDGSGNLSWAACSGGSSSCTAMQELILRDSGNNQWNVSVKTTGHLTTTSGSASTTCTNRFNSVILKDSSGAFWTLSVSTLGNLITTAGGSYTSSVDFLTMTDSGGITWIIKASTAGNLITS